MSAADWRPHVARVRHVGHEGPGRWVAAMSRALPPGWAAVPSRDDDGRWPSEEAARAALVGWREPAVAKARAVVEPVGQLGLFGAP